jgi:hypothetical protein
MALPIGKAHHLVFERWAITRTDALYLAVIEWRLIDPPANEIVNPLIGVKQVTNGRIFRHICRVERKRNRLFIAVFHVGHTAFHAAIEID